VHFSETLDIFHILTTFCQIFLPYRTVLTFPGLYLNPERKIMADAGRHQAGKIIASQSIINSQRTSIGQSTVTQKSTVTH